MNVGPFPSWLMAAAILAGTVWIVDETFGRGAGFGYAGVLLFGVLVIRDNGAAFNDLIATLGQLAGGGGNPPSGGGGLSGAQPGGNGAGG